MKQIVFATFLLIGIDSHWALADDFTADSKKALVIFVADPSNHDFLINAYGVNTDDRSFDAKSGFNQVIGRGTALFGPHTKQYSTSSSKNVLLQEKYVKPGSYIFTGANGGPRTSNKPSTACFASRSKLFTVEAGKVNLVSLPDAKVVKLRHDMDWTLDPQLSSAELFSAYEAFIEQKNLNIRAEVTVAPSQTVSFEPRMKFGSCHPVKKGSYQVIEL